MPGKFVLFTALLTISISNVFSCGYYPYGEDVRYNFLKPHYIFPDNGDFFFYTSDLFSIDYTLDDIPPAHFEENCTLWKNSLGNRFSSEQVYDLIYVKSTEELKTSREEIVQFLHQKDNLKFLNYLLFAKSISDLNGKTNDPWEMEDKVLLKNRKKAWEKALKKAKAEKDPDLKRRYAHLAIRLAFYNKDEAVVEQVYNQYFNDGVYNDAIDYWALFFKIQFEPSSPEKNVKVALIFMNSLEKRNAVINVGYDYFLRADMNAAANDEERIAVLFMAACTNSYKSLDQLEQISDIDPSHPCLDFLALREINKLEDWILTPYYTKFNTNYYGANYEPAEEINDRIEEKREYGQEVLKWFLKLSDKRQTNQVWWKIMKDYCSVIVMKNQNLKSETIKTQINDGSISENQRLFLKKMYMLNVFMKDEDPEVEDPYVRELLMSSEICSDQKLMIALAKELEMHQHTNYAAIMFSKVNVYSENNYDGNYGYWKSPELAETLGDDYFYEYFMYLDATLTTTQVQSLINHIDYKKVNSDFDHWFYDRVKNEFTRFYDMLGTKYMRKDDLKSALSAFNQVNDTLWTSENYPYRDYIGQNPFSNDFYGKSDSRHRKEVKGDYTKPRIVAELIKQINLVNTSTGDKKAMAAFKVANCYRNMSFYGNSWMMRRYFWTFRANLTGLEDDEEYFQCLKAQKYYEIAEENATKRDFKAISLIMNGLCQKYELAYEDGNSYLDYDSYYYYEQMRLLDKVNPAYRKFKKEYGKDYPNAIGNCEAYEGYFKSISSK